MNACDGEFRTLIDAHFGEGLPCAREGRLRAHLPGCPACRAHYEGYLAAEALDPKGRGAQSRLAAALGLPRADTRVGRAPGWRLGILVVAGAACLVLFLARGSTFDGDYTARGVTVARPPMNPDLAVFRVRGDHESEPVLDRISARDELAFAYRNEIGKAFLMIFAVDSAGSVAWYYPAWNDPASNPSAVPITRQVGFKELPEAVRQPLHEGRIALHALFLDSPAEVRSIEERLARGDPLADLAPLRAGEIECKLIFTVMP